MKKLTLVLSLLLAGCRDDHSEQTQQQQQLQQTQAQLAQQTAKAGKLEGVATLLGIGCIVFLFIGAAVGSKARRAVKNGPEQ